MEKADFYADSWIYRHPTKRAVDYTRFLIAPITVYEQPMKKIKHRGPYDALGRTLTDRFTAQFSKKYPVTNKKGHGVLRIQIEVLDIKPLVKTKSGVTDTIIIDNNTKGSKLELDCYDTESGEEIFAISTLYKGDAFVAYEDPSLIPSIDSAFDQWIEFLMERFDEARAKKQTP